MIILFKFSKMMRRITKITRLSWTSSSIPIPVPIAWPYCHVILVSIWRFSHPVSQVQVTLFFFFSHVHHKCFRFPSRFPSIIFPIFLDSSVLLTHKSFILMPTLWFVSVFPFTPFLIRQEPQPFFVVLLLKSSSVLRALLL